MNQETESNSRGDNSNYSLALNSGSDKGEGRHVVLCFLTMYNIFSEPRSVFFPTPKIRFKTLFYFTPKTLGKASFKCLLIAMKTAISIATA